MPDALLTRNNGSARLKSGKSIIENSAENRGQTAAPGGTAPKRYSLLEDLFHEEWPHAKYHHTHDCRRDHELRCYLDLQLNHFDCLSPQQQELIEKVYKRVTNKLEDGKPGYWNRQRVWKNYDWQATVIALSTYENRWRFCNCGFFGYSCNDPLCIRCCYKDRAEPLLKEFRPGFRRQTASYFIVMSLSREPDESKRLIFKDLGQEEQEQIKYSGRAEQGKLTDYGIKPRNADVSDYDLTCQAYWRIFGQTVHQFTGRKSKQIFDGAFGGPELSVRFMPYAVLPHANYLVFSAELSLDNLRRFRRELSRRFRNSRRTEPGVYPKLAVYQVREPKDFQAVVKYMFKPIDVGFAYAVAADADSQNPNWLCVLNRQTDCFLEHLPMIFYGVRRLERYGCCSPNSDEYVGVVSLERDERRQQDAERRAKKKAEQDEIRRIFPAYQPCKRHKAGREREDEILMKRWYRRLVDEGELPGKPPKRWLRKDQRGRRKATPARAGSANPDPRAGQQRDGSKIEKPGQASLRPVPGPCTERAGSASTDHSKPLPATTSQWDGRAFAQGLRDQLESGFREKAPG